MKTKKNKREELLLEIKKLELEIKLEELKQKVETKSGIQIKVVDLNNIKDPKFY